MSMRNRVVVVSAGSHANYLHPTPDWYLIAEFLGADVHTIAQSVVSKQWRQSDVDLFIH